MAGWLDDGGDEIQRNVGRNTGAGFAPKRVEGPRGVSSLPDEQDADDSFDYERRADGKENELPIRRKSKAPPSAPPSGNAPAMPSEMLAKVREKAQRTSQERRLSGRPNVVTDIVQENSRMKGNRKEESERGEYTDEDLDELLREEADIIAHPSVNMSKLRGDRDDADDSDESVEGSDVDGEMERVLGEMDNELTRMPSPKKDGDTKLGSHVSWCMVAQEDGGDTDRVQCTLLRDRFSSRMFPEYQLVLDKTKKPILLGRKQTMNTTSNYHVFDLTRGAISVENHKYTKKSGNYLGKLRASNMDSTDYVLVTKTSGREEALAVSYESSRVASPGYSIDDRVVIDRVRVLLLVRGWRGGTSRVRPLSLKRSRWLPDDI